MLWLFVASLIMMEGLIIVFANIAKEMDSIAEVKAISFAVSALVCGLLFMILPMLTLFTLSFLAIYTIIAVILMITTIGGGIAIVLTVIYYSFNIVDYIVMYNSKVLKFLFSWYINLNKWLIKKALEEDISGKKKRR